MLSANWFASNQVLKIIGFILLWGAVTGFVAENPSSAPMMTGRDSWEVIPLVTIGDHLPSRDPRFPNRVYQPVGGLDGLGAYRLDERTVRVLVNHELDREAGYPYQLDNGTTLTGARVSFLDIDRRTLQILNSGMAYQAIRDRQGRIVQTGFQINEASATQQGFSWFCSGQLVSKGTYNFVDTVYLTPEETSDPLGHPHGGTIWALDVAHQTLHAVPAIGRMTGENTTPLFVGGDRVALLIGDDTAPQTDQDGRVGHLANEHTPPDHVVTAPLWLYVGKKNASMFEIQRALPPDVEADHSTFLNRNGLLVGHLYYFVADQGVRTIGQFHGTGSTLTGIWKKIEVLDRTKAGETGYDRFGYKNGFTLRREAKAGGALQFSRPEDVSTHPSIGTRAVLASTGRDTVFPDHDGWGTVYQVDVDFAALRATLTIVYDGDDAGGAQFSHPDHGIRNPDNLDWAHDGAIYIQEDNAKARAPFFGSHSAQEASIWRLDPLGTQVQRIAQINRSVVLPGGSTDRTPKTIGRWESSGILDVTHLFEMGQGARLLLATIQAHSIQDGMIMENNLVEGGQLVLLKKSLTVSSERVVDEF